MRSAGNLSFTSDFDSAVRTAEVILVSVSTHADTYAPGPPCCTYWVRVPAFCVPYVPEAQGSLPPGSHALYVRCTRTSLLYVPEAQGSLPPAAAALL